jgi:hypothetical protein
VGAWYTTRESVMASPDIRAAAYASTAIDRAIESSSRSVDRLCHVVDGGFAPTLATRSFPYPNTQNADSGRLWLDQHQLISLTSMTSGGVNVPLANVFLEPVNSGPPYTSIEINRGTSSALAMNAGTAQRSITLTGLWGNRADEETAGALTGAVNASVTSWPVNFRTGVGDILRVDTERVRVLEKAWLASGQTGSLTAAMNAQTLAVSDGTVFAIGEELLIDAERVLVRDIAGNNVIVQRAWGGSTLAVHTTATVYWPRTLSVARGQLGTAAASHLLSAAVYRHLIPGPIEELTRAYSLDAFFQAGAGYARTVGSNESERQASGRAIKELEQRVYGSYARQARVRAV